MIAIVDYRAGNLTSVTVVECMVGRSMPYWFPDSYRKIKNIDFVGNIKSLPDRFFDGCDSLESVSVAESVSGFGNCDMRWAVNRNASDGLFIKDGWVFGWVGDEPSIIEIPEGVKGIAPYALCGFYDLESVTLPSTLKYIGAEAFAGDTYLDNVVIPDGVETIGDGAFEDCTYIQTLTIGGGVKTVGRRGFAGCTQLANAEFADGLCDVGEEAFSNCWRMASVSLPISTTNVGSMAFAGCPSLTGVTTPTSHGTMAEWFASVHQNIKNVTVPEGETAVVSNMFAGCTSLATLQLPDGITEIGESAFRDCTSLNEMALPGSVSRIGAGAFEGCSQIATLTLPNGLTELPDNVFAGCDAIDSFVVPASVTNLGSRFCSARTMAIYYLGNAPSYAADAYAGAPAELTSYVVRGTKGWDGLPNSRDIPQTWIGHAITTWEATRFDVTFDANGGKFMPEDADTYAREEITDTGYSLPPDEPVLAGYKFMGYWTERTAGSRVTSSTRVTLTKAHTLYAHWRVGARVTVRFNACGGTVQPGEVVYASEAPYGELPEPVREHCRFAGWWTSANGGVEATVASEVPKADHELFAHWEPVPCVIRFHAGDGTDATCDQEFIYGESVTLLANTFTREGYAFAGWAMTEGGASVYPDRKTLEDVPGMQNDVLHLYATWVSTRYAVRFDANGGVGRMDSQTFVRDVETNLVACAFTRTGYDFGGWAASSAGPVVYADGASVTNVYELTGVDGALYAVWVPIEYSISYDANGGAGLMSAQPMVYDVAAPLACSAFTKPGSLFRGWATASDGAVAYREQTSVMNLTAVADDVVTLYAVWQEKPASVLACEDAFGGAGVVTMDEDNNIVVTLTNDVSGTVEIPDNVGTVIIDLNGCDIVGDGGLVETTLPDGPAIRIVAGDGECADVTQLAIVDTSDGEKGQIADGAAYGVSLEVDDVVSILNGDGTEQDCTLLGRGSLPWPTDGAYNPLVANVYDGYVLDGDGALAGIVQIKAAKQAVKSVTDKVTKVKTATTNITVTATVTDAAGKKWSYSKGVGAVDGVVTGLVCTTKGVLVPSFGVALGANGLEGEWGGSLVVGARNGMGMKGDAMMAALDANYKKSWTVALTNGLGVTHLQFVVGAKGSTKISGVTPDGFKISATVQGIMGDNAFFVPYLTTLKNGKLTRHANLLLTLRKVGAVDVRTSNLGALKAGGPTTDEIEVLPYAESASSKGGEAYAGAVVLNDLAYPAKFAAKGLPAGLKIDAATGAITGIPTKPGRYTATITITSGVNSKKKVEAVVVFDIGNYTDDVIPVADLYGDYRVGVMVYEPIDSVVGCSVSGLPSGLKFATKETKDAAVGIVPVGTVYGIPTKAGEYTVYFKKTEKVNGKSVNHQASATFKVEALPAWAQGTFNGAVFGGVGWDSTLGGLVQNLSVGVNGKISGKLVDADGLTWTLSANSYDTYDPATETYIATVVCKSGKLSVTNAMTVVAETVENPNGDDYISGVATGDDWIAKRDCWKQEPWKTLAKAFAKAPQVTTTDGVSIKFAAAGAITAKGVFTTGVDEKTNKPIVYSGSCSSVLIPEGGNQYVAFVYFPPVAKKFGGYAAAIRLVWDGSSFSLLP